MKIRCGSNVSLLQITRKFTRVKFWVGRKFDGIESRPIFG